MSFVCLTAERPPPKRPAPPVPVFLIVVIVICLATVVVLVGVLYNVARKHVSAPTWFPEGFRFSASHVRPRNNIAISAPKSVLFSVFGQPFVKRFALY